MDWIQQWQSKLNKQNGVAPLVRTGGSRHTGLAALPYRNIQLSKNKLCHRAEMQRTQINGYCNNTISLIIPGISEPPVRTLRATIPENERHIFR